jgi:hypothetical protein
MKLLKHPINFVCSPDILWPELREGPVFEIEGQRLSDLSGGIAHSWIIRTYYELARRGYDVQISGTVQPGHINIAAGRDFGRRDFRLDSFLVVARGDAHLPMLADFVIEQNGVNRGKVGRIPLPHWPQPGLIERDASRAPAISRMVFKGRVPGLAKPFRHDAFKDQLSKRNVDLEIDAYVGLKGEHSWNDYKDADAVLAVRNTTTYQVGKKPASKLINAWISGVVPILGPEPAYRELRRDAYDYIEVSAPEDVLAAIDRLNSDPGLFMKYLSAGQERAKEFSLDTIANQWIAALNGPISSAYEEWLDRSDWIKMLNLSARFALEPWSKRVNKLRATYGRRILGSWPRMEGMQ